MSISGFQDHKKVDGTPNAALPLVVTTTITNHPVSGITIDDGNSFNFMYLKIFMNFGLRKQNLRSFLATPLIPPIPNRL